MVLIWFAIPVENNKPFQIAAMSFHDLSIGFFSSSTDCLIKMWIIPYLYKSSSKFLSAIMVSKKSVRL